MVLKMNSKRATRHNLKIQFKNNFAFRRDEKEKIIFSKFINSKKLSLIRLCYTYTTLEYVDYGIVVLMKYSSNSQITELAKVKTISIPF